MEIDEALRDIAELNIFVAGRLREIVEWSRESVRIFKAQQQDISDLEDEIHKLKRDIAQLRHVDAEINYDLTKRVCRWPSLTQPPKGQQAPDPAERDDKPSS